MCLLRFAHHISVQQYDAALCVKVRALKIRCRPALLLNDCCTALVPVSVQGQNLNAEPYTFARGQKIRNTLTAAEK